MAAELSPQENAPYIGARPFERQDTSRFFGRERECGELFSLIVAHPILLLYAPSGAGKTSLLNAKLIPMLEREEMEVLPVVRVQRPLPTGWSLDQVANPYALNTLMDWAQENAEPQDLNRKTLQDFLKLDYSDSPLLSSADLLDPVGFAAVLGAGKDELDRYLGQHASGSIESLLERDGKATSIPGRFKQALASDLNGVITGSSLYEGQRFADIHLPGEMGALVARRPTRRAERMRLNRALLDAAYPDHIRAWSAGDHRQRRTDDEGLPVLRVAIFDQFEELFYAYPERWRDRETFLQQISRAQEEDPYLHVVLSMREEYIAQLDPYASLLPDRLRIRYRLERLDGDAALLAVTKPLEGSGVSFAEGVAEELVQELLRERVRQPSGEIVRVPGRYVEPVQLQVVCQTLWESLPPGYSLITKADIQQFGDVDEALSGYYEKSMRQALPSVVPAQLPVLSSLATTLVLPLREGRLRKWFEANLITPAGTRGTVYRGEKKTAGISNSVVERLDRESHLVRSEERAGAVWYELSHDRYIEPIQASNRRRRERMTTVLAAVVLVLALVVVTPLAVFAVLAQGETQQTNSAASTAATAAARDIARAQRAVTRAAYELVIAQATGTMVAGEVVTAQAAVTVEAAKAAKAEATGTVVAGEAATAQETAAAEAAARAEAESAANRAESGRLAGEALNRLDSRYDQALLLSLAAYQRDPTLEARNSLLTALQHNPALTGFVHGHSEALLALAFAQEDGVLLSGSRDGMVLASYRSEGTQDSIPIDVPWTRVDRMAFSPDGRLIALGGCKELSQDQQHCRQGEILVWDRIEGHRVGQFAAHESQVSSLAFDPVGSTLATGGCARVEAQTGFCAEGELCLWDLQGQQAPQRPGPTDRCQVAHRAAVSTIAFDPDDDARMASGGGGEVVLWDLATMRPLVDPIVIDESTVVRSIAFSRDGDYLAAGSEDSTVAIWPVDDTGILTPTVITHTAPVLSVAFSPQDPALLVSGSEDGALMLSDAASGPLADLIKPRSDAVFSITFSPDGKSIASGGASGSIVLWNIEAALNQEPRLGRSLPNSQLNVRSVDISPDGAFLASGSDDGSVLLWDVQSGNSLLETSLQHETGTVRKVNFSPDGSELRSAGCREENPDTGFCVEGEVNFWDLSPAGPGSEPAIEQAGAASSIAFSPDGRLLATGGCDDPTRDPCPQGELRLWDVNSKRPVGDPLYPDGGAVWSLAFGPDSQALASGGDAGQILLWDVQEQRPRTEPLSGHQGAVWSLAFAPNGRLMASGGEDRRIVLWNLTARQPMSRTLSGFDTIAWSLAFDPRGDVLASGHDDGTLILWDVSTGQRIGEPLPGDANRVWSVAYRPNGSQSMWLASGSDGGSLTLWDMSVESWQRLACQIVARNLTGEEWCEFMRPDAPYEALCPALPPGEGAGESCKRSVSSRN